MGAISSQCTNVVDKGTMCRKAFLKEAMFCNDKSFDLTAEK